MSLEVFLTKIKQHRMERGQLVAEVMINGPEGRLEALYHVQKKPQSPIAILLHPHPQHGGSMHNKIVFALYKAFNAHGFTTLRFNFRGVGRSQGKFDNGEGELSDAATALDWLQAQNPNASTCWVAGFSFGAWIAMQLLMRRPEMDGFITISPPANKYDFSFLAPCPVSGLIIQGNQDEVVPHTPVGTLAHKLNSQKGIHVDYRLVENADHFFTNHMGALGDHLNDYLNIAMTEPKHPTRAFL